MARVWDVRTKNAVHTLCGHQQTVASVETQALTPYPNPTPDHNPKPSPNP